MVSETKTNDVKNKENVLNEMFGRSSFTGKLKESTLREIRKELDGKWKP